MSLMQYICGLVKNKYLIILGDFFSFFSIKLYAVGTHNICFNGELEKITQELSEIGNP